MSDTPANAPKNQGEGEPGRTSDHGPSGGGVRPEDR